MGPRWRSASRHTGHPPLSRPAVPSVMWPAGVTQGMKFPSAEWAEAFRSAVNQNSAYQEAAKAWEGDIVFLVRTGDPAAPAPGYI